MAHYIKEEDNFRLTSVLFQGNRTLCESRKNIHKISAVKKEKNKVNSVRAVRKRETKRNKSISFGSQFRNLNERKKPVESSRIDFEEEKEKKRILQGWMSPHGGATSGDIVFLFTNRIQFVIPFIIDWKNLLVARVTVSWNGQPAAGRATGLSIGWPHRLFPPPPLRCANNIRLLPPVPPSFRCPATPGTISLYRWVEKKLNQKLWIDWLAITKQNRL